MITTREYLLRHKANLFARRTVVEVFVELNPQSFGEIDLAVNQAASITGRGYGYSYGGSTWYGRLRPQDRLPQHAIVHFIVAGSSAVFMGDHWFVQEPGEALVST